MGIEYYKRGLNVGGATTVRSGGVTVSSGAVTLTAGNLVLSAGGIDNAVQTATTSGTALVTYGLSLIQSGTSNGAVKTYTLAGAAAGTIKYIACITGTTARTATVTLGSGVSFYSTNSTAVTLRKATFNAGNEGLLLVAGSTTRWFVASNINSVALATT